MCSSPLQEYAVIAHVPENLFHIPKNISATKYKSSRQIGYSPPDLLMRNRDKMRKFDWLAIYIL
ncbi:MAG: hypothetical protein CSA18_00060 [Deltaproteobacteria bacterium]|nr:MAG: hypothetical protein CSA18_00060 [Deltaproteobacteria bacterium]